MYRALDSGESAGHLRPNAGQCHSKQGFDAWTRCALTGRGCNGACFLLGRIKTLFKTILLMHICSRRTGSCHCLLAEHVGSAQF